MDFLAARVKKFFTTPSFLQEYVSRISYKKGYDPINEKDGFIDLGVSENKLMVDYLIERFTREDMQAWLPQYQFYFNFQGVPALREALASFFQEKFVGNNLNFQLSPNDIIVTSGASTCFSVLSFCIANESDYILVETPFYSAISNDINYLTDNHVYYVNSKSTDNFCASLSDYEAAYENAKNENKRISAIIIVTPGNPIGNFTSKEKLLGLLNFAKRHNLHVIVDEIYANCIYNKQDEFKSVLSYFDEIPDPLRTHFMWSFSKDFCSAGLRCGVIYSQNQSLIAAISKMSILFCPPYIVQHKLATLLNDKSWVNSFFEINHEKMLRSKQLLVNALNMLDIKTLDSCSGFFIWADFSCILSPTLDAKELTFEKEKSLFEMFFKNGLYCVPGQVLGCVEVGWFRIVFCSPDDFIIEGVNRIKKGIKEFKETFNQ